MKWDSIALRNVIESASGKRPADLLIRNCRMVNVFTGGIDTVDLAVGGGLILGWGSYHAAANVIDAGGAYLAPGFIDGHIHIESTLLGPGAFCAASAPWGTAAVVADPHEIANVLGLAGIRYMLDSTEGAPLDAYFNLPSCVPATNLETSGADLRAADLASLLPHPRILGLAEMMNFPGVLFTVPEVLDKILFFQEKNLDGHAPLLTGEALNAYLATGISSDHECTGIEEAREKLAKGVAVMIREGSQSKDMAALLPLVDDRNWHRFLFVSDDRHPDDLVSHGHMNAIVNRATALGMDPVRAVSLATWTPARHFGLARRGAIAPGYFADFSLSPTLTPWKPERVFRRGVEIARDGKLLGDAARAQRTAEAPPPSPMAVTRFLAEDLRVPAQNGAIRVIGLMEGSLLTRKLTLPPAVENGAVVSDPARDILKIAVFNRYRPDEPPAVGFIQGLGLKQGALGTTVAHDSHNLLVAGATDADMLRVAGALRESRGGMAVGSEADGVLTLPLPVAGLMTDEPATAVVSTLESLKRRAASLGSRLDNPFMALSFMALPVIPELKLTDRGLVDVTAFAFVPLFES